MPINKKFWHKIKKDQCREKIPQVKVRGLLICCYTYVQLHKRKYEDSEVRNRRHKKNKMKLLGKI